MKPPWTIFARPSQHPSPNPVHQQESAVSPENHWMPQIQWFPVDPKPHSEASIYCFLVVCVWLAVCLSDFLVQKR